MSLNRYAYVANNPVNLVDPRGTDFCPAEYSYEDCGGSGGFWGGGGGGGGGGFGGSVGWLNYNVPGYQYLPADILEGLLGYLAQVQLALAEAASGNSNDRQKRFKDCLNKFGDQYAKANLDLKGFDAAIAAGASAGLDGSTVFSLWENESKLSQNFGSRGPAGEIGPIQIRPGVVRELRGAGILPANWNSNLQANLTAGALYYDRLTDHYGIPENQAAAAYNGGPYGYNGKQAQGYQAAFNASQPGFKNLINCMH